MAIGTTWTQINTMVAQTTSTINTSTGMPANLASVKLPFATVLVGPAAWNSQAISYKRQDRQYTVRCWVKPTGAGRPVEDGYRATLAVLQAVGNKFLSSSGLSLENTVDHIGEIADSGVQTDMDFAGKPHYGFDLTFRVTEKG